MNYFKPLLPRSPSPPRLNLCQCHHDQATPIGARLVNINAVTVIRFSFILFHSTTSFKSTPPLSTLHHNVWTMNMNTLHLCWCRCYCCCFTLPHLIVWRDVTSKTNENDKLDVNDEDSKRQQTMWKAWFFVAMHLLSNLTFFFISSKNVLKKALFCMLVKYKRVESWKNEGKKISNHNYSLCSLERWWLVTTMMMPIEPVTMLSTTTTFNNSAMRKMIGILYG